MEFSCGQWKKRQSRSTPGRYYYINKVTKEKSWKLPKGVAMHVSSEVSFSLFFFKNYICFCDVLTAEEYCPFNVGTLFLLLSLI